MEIQQLDFSHPEINKIILSDPKKTQPQKKQKKYTMITRGSDASHRTLIIKRNHILYPIPNASNNMLEYLIHPRNHRKNKKSVPIPSNPSTLKTLMTNTHKARSRARTGRRNHSPPFSRFKEPAQTYDCKRNKEWVEAFSSSTYPAAGTGSS